MKKRFHQYAKTKPGKDSLVDFARRFFFDENKKVDFFMSVKLPEWFVYNKCECQVHHLINRSDIKNSYILRCKKVGKQQTCFVDTILDNSNQTLVQIIPQLYLFFTSNRVPRTADSANNIDVLVKTRRMP